MIVRISSDRQYELSDEDVSRLNELDNEAVTAADASDEARFRDLLGQMIELVRADGKPLGDDELMGSDVILPPPDTTLEEARAEFSGEGLIPG